MAVQAAITEALRLASGGDKNAADRLFVMVYKEFRALANSYLAREAPEHTLQPTALVHEAYLKLVDQKQADWKSRSQFFAVGASAMRRILVDHARAKQRHKRGGGAPRVAVEEALLSVERGDHVLAVNDALEDLARLNERHAKVVELRFFGGLNVAETAEALSVSITTVERDWRFCNAWLKNRLRG